MIEPKDGEWWMVEHDSGDKRVMRYWLRDGDSDAVWNVFEDESDSFITAHSTVKPLYKMVKAGGMENLESDYERGMREAMKDIAKSCGKTFSVDIGYLDLPKLVDSFVNKEKPKPRTKVVYEPVNQNGEGGAYWECARDFANGVEFASSQDNCNINDNRMLLAHYENRSLCRVVEKEIDWKDGVKSVFEDFELLCMDNDFRDCVNDERLSYEFIKVCHLVASLTDKPE